MNLLKHRFLMPEAAGAGGGSGSGTTRVDSGAASSSSSGTGSGSGATGATGSGESTGSSGGGSAAGSGGSSGSSAASGASGQGSQGSSTSAAASGAGGSAGAAGAGSGAGDNWDANWREKWSNNDEKKLNWSKRYTSPSAMLDAAWNAQQKISSGELKAPLPKDATPEQITAYRKDNGIPETAAGYFDKLPDGVKLDEADRAMLAPYTEIMHKHNLSPEAAGEFLAARAKVLDDLMGRQVETDKATRVQVEDELRKDWGAEYRSNVNNIHALFAGAPEDVRESILSARGPDGVALFNNAKTMQYFAQLARQMNPFGVILGGDGGALDQKGVEARIAELGGPKFMGNSNSEYWKGPTAEKLQKEYRDLIDARDRMRQRAA